MQRLVQFYGDNKIEVSEQDYLAIIESMAEATVSTAKMLIGDQTRGYPDLMTTASPEGFEAYGRLTQGIPEIDDAELQQHFLVLKETTDRLWELENELIQIVADFVKVPVPTSINERRWLHQQAEKLGLQSEDTWKSQTRFLKIVVEAYEKNLLTDILKSGMDKRLAYLREQLDSKEEK